MCAGPNHVYLPDRFQPDSLHFNSVCHDLLIYYRERVVFALQIVSTVVQLGAKGDWDFRISDLVKNPDGTDI